MRIGIVAGETSGDILAAGMMQAIKDRLPEVEFIGIGGPRMEAVGFKCLWPSDAITMMGLEGGIEKIRSIWEIRQLLKKRLKAAKLTGFVGVDVPDFNLGLERYLRAGGIPVVHYVSPSVWAWRGYRIGKIKQSVDRVLTLFPFEVDYYARHQVPATFVGHPAATRAQTIDKQAARARLGIKQKTVIALLPGSRTSEVTRLLQPLLDAAKQLYAKDPNTHFLLPLARPALQPLLARCDLAMPDTTQLPLSVFDGQADDVLQAADLSILASGTAALESLLYLTPMVIVYKVSAMTRLMVTLLKNTEYYSLPNHLLAEPIVPELIQEMMTVDNIVKAARHYLDQPDLMAEHRRQYAEVAGRLRQNADEQAADAVLYEFMKGSSHA